MESTICRAREGDRTALLKLIDHCKGAIMASIAAIQPPATIDLDEAAHLAQLQIFNKFGSSYDGSGTPCAWMAIVARNRTRDLIRAESRHSDRSISMDLVDGVVCDQAGRSTAAVETWDLVSRILAELPPSDAELLTLHYLHGLSRQELAERLGYSYDGVRSKLTRACAKAHQILKDSEGER